MINTKCMLQLYKALVVPQLEYAVSVWQIGNCTGLDRVQRKGLAMCLGVPGTAGIEALQVEAEVKPLEIRPRGYKTFFILNSAELEIYPAHKC